MAGVKAPTKTVQLFQLTCFPLGHKVSKLLCKFCVIFCHSIHCVDIFTLFLNERSFSESILIT